MKPGNCICSARSGCRRLRSPPRRLLDRAVALPLRRPRLVALGALLVLAASLVALGRMRLQSNVEEILGTPASRGLAQVSELFGWRERAYLLIEADGPGRQSDSRSHPHAVESINISLDRAPAATSVGSVTEHMREPERIQHSTHASATGTILETRDEQRRHEQRR